MEGPNSRRLKSAEQTKVCVEISKEDRDDNVLGSDEIREVTVMAPNKTVGCWNKSEVTAVSLRNGRIYTEDVGHIEEEGSCFLVDRSKDMIASGGDNVYSSEVENAILRQKSVQQSVVIGIPGDKWGELVQAEVILRDGESTAKEVL